MVIETCFLNNRKWKRTQISINGKINKYIVMNLMEFYTVIKMNEVLLYVTWINLTYGIRCQYLLTVIEKIWRIQRDASRVSRWQVVFCFLSRVVVLWMCPVSDNQNMHL